MEIQLQAQPNVRILKKGLTFCRSCNRAIDSELILKDNFLYINSYCEYEKKSREYLVTRYDYPFSSFFKRWEWGRYKPKHWPQVKRKFNTGSYKLSNNNVHNLEIKNFSNVPNVILKLTARCNLDCKFCIAKSENEKLVGDCTTEMDINYIQKILDKYNRTNIILFGGEPTIREDLDFIIKAVRKSSNLPILFTNGLKLSNLGYLKKLKDSGLKNVCFSIDGKDSFLLENNRNQLRKFQHLKLEALKNLEKERLQVNLQTTLLQSTYLNQIAQVLNLAVSNKSINDIWFRSIYLLGKENYAGIDKEEIVSIKMMQRAIADYLEINPQIFPLWNELKFELAKFLCKNFKFYPFFFFQENIIYLKKEEGCLRPFFNERELRYMVEAFRCGRYTKFFRKKLIPILLKFMKELYTPGYPEEILSQNNIVRIRTEQFSIPKLMFIPDKGTFISSLFYFPDGTVNATPAWEDRSMLTFNFV